MHRNKKSIIIAALAAVMLVGSMAAVALAQTGGANQTSGPGKTVLARVATILGIEQKKVEDAFAQAQREMQAEALDNYLKDQVAQGRITQPQADQYKAWWQARPNIPIGPGPMGPGGPGPRGPRPPGPSGKPGPLTSQGTPLPKTN